MAGWSDITLYTIDEATNDLARYEPQLAGTATDDDRDLVKARIEDDLLNRMRHLQQLGESRYGKDFFLLDHLENPAVLQRPACYYAIYLYFRGRVIVENDEFARRSYEYEKLFALAFDAACRRLRWSKDLIDNKSGQIKLTR